MQPHVHRHQSALKAGNNKALNIRKQPNYRPVIKAIPIAGRFANAVGHNKFVSNSDFVYLLIQDAIDKAKAEKKIE